MVVRTLLFLGTAGLLGLIHLPNGPAQCLRRRIVLLDTATGAMLPFVFVFGGSAFEAAIELIVVGAAMWVLWSGLLAGSKVPLVPLLAVAGMCGLVLVSILNRNVPSLVLFAQGSRRALLFPLAVLIGVALARRDLLTRRVGYGSVGFMLGASALCFLQLIDPISLGPIPVSLPQRAAEATQDLFGLRRSTGPFAGPFHLALAGALGAIVALYADLSKRWRVVALSAAACVLAASLVRTGLLAFLAIGVTYAVQRWALRLRTAILLGGGVALLAVLLLAAVPLVAPAAWTPQEYSISNVLTDQRLLGRFHAFEDAFSLIEQRPLTGWGPGSAADTINGEFLKAGSAGVSPHNVFLKYGVELGLPGLLCFLSLIGWLVARLARSRGRPRSIGLAVLAAAAPFALSGTFVDALPPALVVGLILGHCARCPRLTPSGRQVFSISLVSRSPQVRGRHVSPSDPRALRRRPKGSAGPVAERP